MKGLKQYIVPFLLFLIVVLFSLFSFERNMHNITMRRQKMFDARMIESVKEISGQMRVFEQLLKSTSALFYIKDTITSEDWSTFVTQLRLEEYYPGIQGLGYAPLIDSSLVGDITSNVHKTGFKEFQVYPKPEQNDIVPIVFLEPFTPRNKRAIGFDMLSDPIRAEAMLHARDSNKVILTGKVILKQEIGQNIQPGFLLYMPVYHTGADQQSLYARRKLLKGFVYNPFRSGDLMNSVLRSYSDLDFTIYDGQEKTESALLYRSEVSKEQNKSNEFTKDTTIKVLERPWTIALRSNTAFGSKFEKRQPYLILFSGLTISLLLLILSIMEMKRRAHTVNELKLVKELDKKKEEFIGIASHELKTPLTSLKAYLQLLERTNQSKQYENQETYIRKASNYLDKLQELISDLLDVSKIGAGKLNLRKETFEFDAFVHQVIDSFKPTIHTHEISMEGTSGLTVHGDKHRIEQVINNMLTNAIKYSPDGKKIEVRIFRDENNVVISVKDYGIGIPEEKHKMIFDRFYRVETDSYKFQGLGIGLYISAEMVRNHDGKIWVESAVNQGSTFYVSFPATSNV